MSKKVTAEEFDRMAEDGEDLSAVLQPASTPKSITIDLPVWMIGELDTEAARLNIARKALINIWLSDKIETAKMLRGAGERRRVV